VAASLTPGTYTVRAEAKGFRTVEHSGVLVEVGQTIRVDLLLQPGEQAQTITVTGEIPSIDTTDATLGGTVTNRSIMELPLNGRNFERLLDLRPGTVSTPGAGTGSSNANGRRIQNNTFRVEGIIQTVNTTGSSINRAKRHRERKSQDWLAERIGFELVVAFRWASATLKDTCLEPHYLELLNIA
jgi:hypothetical protein